MEQITLPLRQQSVINYAENKPINSAEILEQRTPELGKESIEIIDN